MGETPAYVAPQGRYVNDGKHHLISNIIFDVIFDPAPNSALQGGARKQAVLNVSGFEALPGPSISTPTITFTAPAHPANWHASEERARGPVWQTP